LVRLTVGGVVVRAAAVGADFFILAVDFDMAIFLASVASDRFSNIFEGRDYMSFDGYSLT
jgi:hypothetical protein